ncbi:hypothetical protein [Priestia aryabhattai]|uniref:hypothetical protein n=1 Tax=Priestia aryabhattai TaxID=412384 RepID=UPI0015F35C59|nr:hypothetical protein [Priestia aryabhattai]
MGYMRHNAIVVTGDGYEGAQIKLNKVYEQAKEIFGDLVSNMIDGKTNGIRSFFIAPDGSKEGWDVSDLYNSKREALATIIDSMSYEDGSNPIQFVDVGYDEDYVAEVDRTNKGIIEGI